MKKEQQINVRTEENISIDCNGKFRKQFPQ